MSSPVEHPITSIIKIDRNAKDPIYLQVVYQFINAVKRGTLKHGNQLPGSRLWASELKIHRRTVVAALEELKAQDWIESIPNVGTFVKNDENPSFKTYQEKSNSQKHLVSIRFYSNYILENPVHEMDCPYFFTDGLPDFRIIQSEELARFYSGVLKRKNKYHQQKNIHRIGNLYFKEQLSYYLNTSRNLHLNKNQLITSSSREIILNIITQMFVKKGDVVLVGEKSYFFSNMIFRQAGAKVTTIPMDHEGLDTNYILKNFEKGKVRMLYLNSKFSYPTCENMSENRRKSLLELSKLLDILVVEDDTDFEISYDKQNLHSLYKEKNDAWVIYLGAFGRFLIPGFQSYFMVAPENIIHEAQKYLSFYGNTDDYKEQALGEMIAEGDIHRYRRKIQKIYRERQNLFVKLLNEYFPKEIQTEIPNGGMALWLNVNAKISLIKWVDQCLANGLYLPKYCLYQDKNTSAIRLGYAHMNEEEMKTSVQIFRKSFDETMDNNSSLA